MGIQTQGIASGLDVNGLVTKLMQVESQPLASLATKEASYQAKLTAYGSLNSAVSTFQTSLTSLNTASTFQALTGSASDSTIVSASIGNNASAGSFNVVVNKLAQAQGISSIAKAKTSDTIGNGTKSTVTFQFGTIAGTADSTGKFPAGSSFTQDPNVSTGTVTIDSTNNSLQGMRDAINTAKVGVTASIVGDGSATPYRLIINSNKSGVASSLKISVTGDDQAVTDFLTYDPAGTQNFSEINAAQNASLKVNGIDISSASNTVTGALQGVTLNLSKIGTSSVNVSANSTAIQTSINSFVKAYNDLNSTINSLSAYNPATKKGGALLGDSTTQSIQNQIRNALSTAVNGLGGGLTTLSSIGITVQKDGALAVDAGKLSSALNSKADDVAGLFASVGKASDSFVSVNSSASTTKAGSYKLEINQLATQTSLTGNIEVPESTTIDPDTKINVNVDGINTSVSLTAGTYDRTQLLTQIQTAINGNKLFANSPVSISLNTDNQLSLQSKLYGSASNIAISNASGTSIASFLGDAPVSVKGIDVGGTLNGIAATGSGQTLTAANNSDAKGLKITIAGGVVGSRGTVNFSRGYASQLDSLLSGFVGTSGSVASSTDGVNRSIKAIGKERTALNNRLLDIEARYRAQFTSLDKVVSGLNNTSSFLTQQLASLNGSSSN